MHNIQNLKDPTLLLWLLLSSPFLLCLLTILIGAYLTPMAAAATTTTTNTWSLQNVSCIAHDVKFTCDCRNMQQAMQLPPLYGEAYQMEVRNCKSLTINGNTLAGTKNLQKIHFSNVENLILHKYALAMQRYASNTPLIIEFVQVNFELIDSYAIEGNIGEISFTGGRIDVIQPFGFAIKGDRAILLKMNNVHIKRIEQQAFKKFAVEQMEIKNCIFAENLPTRAFYELEVLNTFNLQYNQFQFVHAEAFCFNLILRLVMIGNTFTGIDGIWFEAHILNSINIRENNFGITNQLAFRGLTVHRDYQLSEHLELRFINNTVKTPGSNSTHTDVNTLHAIEFDENFSIRIERLFYDNTWPCTELILYEQRLMPRSHFFRMHIDNVYFRRQQQQQQQQQSTEVMSTRNTNDGSSINRQNYVVLNKLIEWDCQQTTYTWLIVGSCTALLVLLIILIVLLVWCRIVKRRKERKMHVIQPEPRTYKETQIIYQIENAGLLKTDL